MELPIFPLNGAVLFPGASLPLNIFEKRYLEMIDYSLARERLIGMIQTKDNDDLYNVGCIGKIHSFSETNDGRYLISLQGTKCFKVNEELEKKYSFRIISANIINNFQNKISITDSEKKSLLKKYEIYIKNKNINLNLEEIEIIEIEQIIKFIAMVSPFSNIDKQALLETKDDLEFFKKLISILELEIAGDFSNNTIN